MAFDWLRFFDANRIEYASRGHNVSHGHVAIHCPFCGVQDAGQHLSVALNGRGWRCFRQPDIHRGKSSTRLISALLNCSFETAAKICGEQIVIPDDFMARVDGLLNPPPLAKPKKLVMPVEFRPFVDKPSCWPYLNYLKRRGFVDLLNWAKFFDLRYCTTGFFHHRVIFPIRYRKRLVSFTGRSLDPHSDVRYLSLTSNPELAEARDIQPAQGPITDYLLWYDECAQADADTIYLVEGPMDAFKIWQLGEKIGIVAVCVFTATASPAQIDKLHELLPRFKRKFIMLDQGADIVAARLRSQLSGLHVQTRRLPDGIKDPGTLVASATTRKFLRA